MQKVSAKNVFKNNNNGMAEGLLIITTLQKRFNYST